MSQLKILNNIELLKYILSIISLWLHLGEHILEITLLELQKHLDNAHIRLHCKIMEISELSELISNNTARNLMERFKKAIITEENVSTEDLRKLLCGIWVFHDLGMIQFEKRTEGLAITVQEMILNNKKELAARLIPILENITEHMSEEKVSVIE